MGGLRYFAVFALLAGSASLAWASRSVRDETGQMVVVPDHPHRIVCLVPSVVDVVFSLGAGGDVVGVSDYVKYPAEAMKKPSVGTILTPSLEAIVALHPDVVLAMRTADGAVSVEKLRHMGMAVFLVDPHGIDGIYREVQSVGDALNRKREADAEVATLRVRVDRVRARVAGKPAFSVFLPIWDDPVMTIGRGAFLTELIAVAGARSVTADLNQEWPTISLEAVVARAPDALLLKRGGRMSVDALAMRPGWSALAAVKARRVYFMDDRMELVSPVAIDGLEALAREFHP